jgi:hypothetical protein
MSRQALPIRSSLTTMRHGSSLSLFAALLLSVASFGCASGNKPPETPETPASTAEPESAPAPSGRPSEKAATPAQPDGEPGPAPKGPDVPKGMSMDSYEMTPSDCNALGRHYGEVARSDQMKDLSPKLNEKQRAATMAQIDKVVGKNEENWTNGCHSTLEGNAVDHDAIKCALAAKTVHDFDVCINGPAGTPQPATKPGKKKK